VELVLAYIDPGAGSLVVQAVIATVLVVPFFLRTQIRRAVDTIRGRRPDDMPTAPTGEPRSPTAD
jgi:hypothetical protein